jgi:hypothetical protein
MKLELEVAHPGGLTSCLSVILHNVVEYKDRTGYYPKRVNASRSFQTCKDFRDQNLHRILLAKSVKYQGAFVTFYHDDQFSRYKYLPLGELKELAKCYCWPSSTVGDTSYNIRQVIGRRTVVIYRGNDKEKEINRTPYEVMLEAAKEAGGPYVVQTDELEFFEAFIDRFPNTIAMPGSKMIRRDPGKVVTGDSLFAIRFLAALYAASQAPRIVTTTGNTGLWPMIWRGSVEGVWQVHPYHGVIRPEA